MTQKQSKDIHYKALADGVKHFKETEEGREIMCESVQTYAEKYGDKRELRGKINSVSNLMENMKWSLEQALNALGIQGEERVLISKQLQK